MDIVYSLAPNCGDDLRYSLRSLVNVPHDKVYFVGGFPKWAKNVIHIPSVQTGTKWQNVPRNIIEVCEDSRVSDDFIYFNDDFFVLQKVKNPQKELNLYKNTITHVLDRLGKKHTIPTNYMVGMAQTQTLLKELGKAEPLCYELHIPFVFNKDNFLRMFDIEGVHNIDVLHYRSLYGNLYLIGGKDMPDVKLGSKGVFSGSTGQFLSCSNASFPLVKPFLERTFPDKCPYEI